MTVRILLSTTSYQDTPGSHHDLLESQGWDIGIEQSFFDGDVVVADVEADRHGWLVRMLTTDTPEPRPPILRIVGARASVT